MEGALELLKDIFIFLDQELKLLFLKFTLNCFFEEAKVQIQHNEALFNMKIIDFLIFDATQHPLHNFKAVCQSFIFFC